MWWSKKEVEKKDRLENLKDTIKSIYKFNPYVGEITLGLYREDIYRIQQSIYATSLTYDNFCALLNGSIQHFSYEGVKLYLAKGKNRIDQIIVGDKVLIITDLKEFKKGK